MNLFKGTQGNWSVFNNSQTRKGDLGLLVSWDERGLSPTEIASFYTSSAKANVILASKAPEMLNKISEIIEEFYKGNQPTLAFINECEDLVKSATESQ